MAKVGKVTNRKACGCHTLPKRRKSSNVRKFICATHCTSSAYAR